MKGVIQLVNCPDGFINGGFHNLFVGLLDALVVPVSVVKVVRKSYQYADANNTTENNNDDGEGIVSSLASTRLVLLDIRLLGLAQIL